MKKNHLLILVFLTFLFSCTTIQKAINTVVIDDKTIETLISKGNYKEAFKKAELLAKRGFPEGYYYAGFLILSGYVKKPEETGIDYLIKAYKLGYKKAAIVLGNFYYEKGEFPKAAYWFKEAYNHGYTGVLLKKLESEIKSGYSIESEIEELQKKAENQPQLCGILGDILNEIGRIFEAIKCYKKAYKYNYKLGLKLAKLLINKGRDKEAEKILKETYSNGIEEAALELGKLYETKAKKLKLPFCPFLKAKSPKEYFLTLLSLRKAKETYLKAALSWYRASYNLPEARYRALRIKWLLSNKRCPDISKVIFYAKLGVKPALYDLQKLLTEKECPIPESFRGKAKLLVKNIFPPEEFEINPGRIYYIQALKYLKENRKEEAIKLLERACEFGYRNAEYKLAILLFNKKPELSAAVLFTYAKEGDPKAMFYLSHIYLNLNQVKEYKSWLKKSANLGYIPAVKELVNIYLEENRDKEALSILEKYKKQGFCFAYIALGEYYKSKLNLRKAEKIYQEGLKKNCIKSVISLAQLYFLEKKYDESLRLLQIIQPKNLKIYVLLFKIFLRKGNISKAANYLKLAVETGYVPSPNEMEKFKKYINWKTFYNKGNNKLKARILMFLASKTKNFFKAFCETLKAAEYGEPTAPMHLIDLTRNAEYNPKEADFIKKVSKDPGICNRFLLN